MFDVSTRSLKILSALFWYVGGIVLLMKGSSMLLEANALKPDGVWCWYAAVLGFFLGALKVRFIFSKVCRKNLVRIYALEQPKIWQFFRPGFFMFLLLMIVLGASLSRAAHGNYPFLIGMAILDFSLAVALIGSSYVFWVHKPFVNLEGSGPE